MTPVEFYIRLYKMLENVTPLSKDCGVLCDQACCKEEDGEHTGMLLFPCEEYMLNNASFGQVEDYGEYYGDKQFKIFFCNEPCDRKLRPLACRIFPLTPYYKDGELDLIMNPMAKKMCPLARSLEIEQLEEDFVENVYKVINNILKLKDGKAYIEALTKMTDDVLDLQKKFI